ncbi:MAG: M20/M25/M40 family metallo-hydrolase [Phycisphaerae bacterium]|nr:M20/M25/M40 family metallo-hydrolase [Phycisphaerae bacterium]
MPRHRFVTRVRQWCVPALLALCGCAAEPKGATTAAGGALETPGSYAVIDGKKETIPDVRMGDAATVARIIDEGSNRGRVMEHLTHLSTGIGARLTGSTNVETANVWARDQFERWGLFMPAFDGGDEPVAADPARRGLWQWGRIATRFDRGPSTGRVVSVRNPGSERPEYRTVREMEFTALSWSSGTNGPVRGPVVKMPESDEQLEAMRDRFKGAWVLVRPGQAGRRDAGMGAGGRLQMFADIRTRWKTGEPAPEPPAADKDLTRFEGTMVGGPAPDGVPFTLEVKLSDPGAVTGTMSLGGFRTSDLLEATFDPGTHELRFRTESPRGSRVYALTLDADTVSGQAVLPESGGTITYSGKRVTIEQPKRGPSLEERVLAQRPAGWILSSSNELVITSGAPGWGTLDPDTLTPDVIVTVRQSDYDCMNSRLADGVSVEAEFDLRHTFVKGPIPVYNTIAEIKGSELPDEVVIVSGHLDSWDGPGSQGCTDNGTGSAVTLEAARILAAVGAKPRRTIRFILWTGEEQGLLGSAAYVKRLKERGQLEKISAVLVDDGGTNWEGGLPCVESEVAYLAAATAPVNGVFYSETDKKFMDVNIRREKVFNQVSGSDHASFMRARVPGFFWDEVGRADYNHAHHTQHDRMDQAVPEYLRQSATCAAVTAYNLACAPALLPRPTDEEWPQRGRSGAGDGGAPRRRDSGG